MPRRPLRRLSLAWSVPFASCALLAMPPLSSGPVPSGAFAQAVRNTMPGRSVAPPGASGTYWTAYDPRRTAEVDPETEPSLDSAEAILSRFMNLHTASRFEEARLVAVRLADVVPDRPVAHYNLACTLARMNRANEAMAALERAVDCGWRNTSHTLLDPDLALLARDTRFESLVGRMAALSASERIPSGPLRDDPWTAVVTDLRREIPVILDRYHVPGATVALVREGRCVWRGAFGEADVRSTDAMRVETVFRVATPAHLLAIMAATQLDDAHKLDLAAVLLQAQVRIDGRDRFPDRSRRIQPARQRRVSRSNLRRRDIPEAFGPSWARQQALARVSPTPAHARWPSAARTDEMLELLYVSVEIASGKPFGHYCRDRILVPLKLRDTGLELRPQTVERLTANHSVLGTAHPPALSNGTGPAAAFTTVTDLARLLEVMVPRTTPPVASVLPRHGAARIADAGGLDLGRLGLALRSDETASGLRVQAADVTGDAGCLMRWYPDSRVGIVVLFNSSTGRPAALRIAQLALGGT